MEHTKKLMLVDPASYCRQQKTEYTVPNPAINTLGSLDGEMKTILDGGYNEDEKIKLYEQALQRYMTMYRKHIPTPPAFNPRQVVSDEDIIGTVPNTYKTNASSILKLLKRSGRVTWNDKGEVMYDGNIQPGTHVSDLLNDIVRSRKNFAPQGAAEFVAALKEAAVPQTVIGNKTRWFAPQQLGQPSMTSPQSSSKRRRALRGNPWATIQKRHGKRISYSPSPSSSFELETPTKDKSPSVFRTPTTSKGHRQTIAARFTNPTSKDYKWETGKK